MQMDAGLDTGDMLTVAECDITPQDTGASLHDKLMLLGAETLISVLPAIADAGARGEMLQGAKQNDADACYAAKLHKAEARINWTRSAVEIERAVRAYNSWPVAYCYFEKNGKDTALRLWQATVASATGPAADISPGQVVAESTSGIEVATGEGILRITELQPEGKRKMPVADFVNAHTLLQQTLK
jgi:methionyl-tRNA formyltransferase